MLNKNSVKNSFRENRYALNVLKSFWNVQTDNKAIHKSIEFIQSNCAYSLDLGTCPKLSKFLSQKYRVNDITGAITIKTCYLENLSQRYKIGINTKGKYKFNLILHCLVTEMLLIIDDLTQVSSKSKSLYYMHGQKNELMCTELNKVFDFASKTCTEYSEAFTGTSNVFFHLNNKFNKYDLNDLNYRTVNFLKVLRDKSMDLKLRLGKLELTKDKFIELKNKETFTDDIDDAVSFFYTRYMSVRGNEVSFNYLRSESPNDNKSTSDKNKINNRCINARKRYTETINRISTLSNKLANVNITSNEAFKFIKRQLNNSNLLLYVDSPYPYTEDYYNIKDKKTGKKIKVQFNHRKLSDMLCMFAGKFVYSCRTTFSKGNVLKGYPDSEMRLTIDTLYKNKGLYYIDIPLKGFAQGQIERIITNFYFDGATKYE